MTCVRRANFYILSASICYRYPNAMLYSRMFLPLFMLLFHGVSLAAAEVPVAAEWTATAQQLMDAARQDNAAYTLVSSLTTEVGPRLAGTAAEERARAGAVSALRGLGFDNVRVEPFTVPLW